MTGLDVLQVQGSTVTVRGTEVDLTTRERQLLDLLLRDPLQVHSKETLLRAIWGSRNIGSTTRTLDSNAVRLRQKLGVHGDRFVVNVWGVGYRLLDAPPQEA